MYTLSTFELLRSVSVSRIRIGYVRGQLVNSFKRFSLWFKSVDDESVISSRLV